MKVKYEPLSELSNAYDIEGSTSLSSDKVVIINSPSQCCPDVISLKPQQNQRSLCHTVLTPVWLETNKGKIGGMAIELLWAFRGKQDIAAIFVNKAFEMLRKNGCPFVVVIGKPDYYSRLGFEHALNYSITGQFNDNSLNTLMIHFISHIPDRNISGQIRYSKVLDRCYN